MGNCYEAPLLLNMIEIQLDKEDDMFDIPLTVNPARLVGSQSALSLNQVKANDMFF